MELDHYYYSGKELLVTYMRKERRGEGNQVPDCLVGALSELQLQALHRMENFGWMLAFIRRPLFQDIVPVLSHSEGRKVGILEEDGSFNLQPDIDFRC
jgi:hypothetical protein